MSLKNMLVDISDVNVGHHVGLFYNNENEHRTVITEYLRLGLERGEKVLYVADDRPHELIVEYLMDDGLELQKPLATGQFTIISSSDAYMKNGRFEPHRVIDILWDERGTAVSSGYPALRITSEMSWVLKNPSVYQQFVIYEEELNRFLPSRSGFGNCLSLCQYDLAKFPPDLLSEIFLTHPFIITGNEICENHNYQPPEIFFSPERHARALEHQLNSLLQEKKILRSLLKNNEKYYSIFDCAPVGMQLFSKKGKLIAANHTCLDMFGVRDISLLEEFNLFKSFNATNRITEKAGMSDTIRFESAIDFNRLSFLNLVDSRRYGTLYLDVTVTEIPNGMYGFAGGYLVCLQDITRRKREEQHLKKSEDRFRSVIEVASDAILSCDSTGNIISWNNGAEIIFGYAADEIIGKPVSQIVAERSLQDFEEYFHPKNKNNNNASQYIELYAIRRTGIDFPAEVSISKWRAGAGDFFTIIIRDISERKKIEYDLRLKESVVSSSINPVAIVNLDGTINYVNSAFLKLWGYGSPEEIIGRPATTFWDSPANAVRTIISDAGKGWIGELKAWKQDGSAFSVQLSSTVIGTAGNRPSFMVASFVPVIDSIPAVPAPINTFSALATLADFSPDYFTVWDSHLELKELNLTSSHLFPPGLPAEQYKGTSLYTLFPGLNKEVWHTRILEAIKSGHPINIENMPQNIDRQKKFLTLSFVKLADGLIGMIASERQRTDKELAARNYQFTCCARIEQIINSSTHTDVALKEIVQLLPGIVSHPEIAAARIIAGEHEYRSGKYRSSPWKMTARLKANGQELALFEVVYTEKQPERDEGPFSCEEHQVLGIMATMTAVLFIPDKDNSISAKEIERVVEQEGSKRIEFTIAMAHEIKTRLTPILASSDMLATELKEEPWAELAQSVNRGAVTLDARLNSILDIALSDAGNLSIDYEDCSIKDIIDDVARDMIPVTSYYRQSLVADIPDNLPHLKADSKRLKQVLTSFIETAARVTPEGGIIRINARKKSGKLQVEIADTSSGLTEEQKKFLQASQPSRAGRESLRGLGFGLSLSKNIIDLHHGTMWINSEKGKGNIFGFSIPFS